MLKTGFRALFVASLVVASSAACATKTFVAESVERRASAVEARIATVERWLESKGVEIIKCAFNIVTPCNRVQPDGACV